MITNNSRITYDINISVPVQKAVKAFERDIQNVCLESNKKGRDIYLNVDESIPAECFTVKIPDNDSIMISASEDLGLIYGIYHVSKYFLGVNEFWFWNEQVLEKLEGFEVPEDYFYESKPFKVKYRGWFINDEVLFDGWKKNDSDNMPWEMAFEALLRCGGNMTIPGTDFNAHKYMKLAADYGLWITHHHAEPMGARMFARAYPELEASFDKHPDLFRGLWREAIEDQKDVKVIWNIGFRGQGDRPFWVDDPAYNTQEARGKLVSNLMLEQYNMIKEQDKEAVCCMNLYGEIMELYRDGFLSIPEDVIKIWADNGFGKMVSRRQNNHNPRVPALPEKEDKSNHGIYYHASFYDLQAAAMMTMLPNSPEFVIRQLSEVFDRGADDFWIINCSNVKPHTYYLDLIARIWRGEICPEMDEAKAKETADGFTEDYCEKYYRSEDVKIASDIAELYRLWPLCSVKYGPNEDDHAGEQFSNHGARILASQFISSFDKEAPEKTKKTNELNWLIKADSLSDQVKWHTVKYLEGVKNYEDYLQKCKNVKAVFENESYTNGKALSQQLEDNLICQVKYLYYSYLGAYHICKALEICLCGGDSRNSFIGALEETGESKNIDYISAFYEAGLAKEAFSNGYKIMRSHEQGIWQNFYKNDCEADIKQSAYVAGSLMSYLRILGDGPHFYKWQRHFQQDAGGDKVHLILRIKEHLSDDEIFELMKA